MPLAGTGTALGNAVGDAVAAANPSMTADEIAKFKSTWDTIATVIVAHIVANALVSGSANVMTAPGTAPVTGSIG